MPDDHPSLETLARWLAGELEHEQVRRELSPHFLASCPTCRQMQEEIDRLLKESGHWNEAVAVLETREAPELLPLLGEGSHEERMRRAEEIEALHTWGVCQLLLKKSREEVFSDPARAVETAHLAARVAGHLVEAYHPGWVLDLEAQALAHLGNARRVLGELQAADDAFLEAEERLRTSTTASPALQAELLSLKSSLRIDQRRLEEAHALTDEALALYRECQDSLGIAKTLLQKSKILNQQGRVQEAIRLIEESASHLDPARDPRLYARARQNLLFTLHLAGRYEEAAQLLPEVQALYQLWAGPVDWLRLRWTEGNIVQGLGRHGEAEALYREVQQEFLTLGKSYDVALISLDLAALLCDQGRSDELKRLSAWLAALFESKEVHREALASLLLFQQACAEERVTLELIRQIATQLACLPGGSPSSGSTSSLVPRSRHDRKQSRQD